MNNLKIVYTDPSSRNVHVVFPFHREEGWGMQEWWDFHGSRLPSGATDALIVEEIPDHPSFQPAWYIKDGQIRIDMAKARDIWRQELRNARGPLLQALDLKKMQALHSGTSIDTTAERKHLLDATNDPRIEEAQTIDELIKVWPFDNLPVPAAPPKRELPPPQSPVYADDPIPEFLTKTEEPPIPSVPDWSLKDLMAAAEEPHQQPPPVPAEVAPPAPAPEIPPVAVADHYEPVFNGQMELPPAPLPPIPEVEPERLPEPVYEPEPAPSIVETVKQVVMPTWAREKLPDMPVVLVSDAERRKLAEAAITKALSGLTIITPEQSIRYEVALQARNGSVPHKMMLEDEATEAGASMEAFCDRIIMERTLQEQRIMRAYAIKARTLRSILDMDGAAIDEAAAVAAQEIKEV